MNDPTDNSVRVPLFRGKKMRINPQDFPNQLVQELKDENVMLRLVIKDLIEYMTKELKSANRIIGDKIKEIEHLKEQIRKLKEDDDGSPLYLTLYGKKIAKVTDKETKEMLLNYTYNPFSYKPCNNYYSQSRNPWYINKTYF